jgi:hypothetical protein
VRLAWPTLTRCTPLSRRPAPSHVSAQASRTRLLTHPRLSRAYARSPEGVLLSIVALLVITRALWYSMDVEFHSRLAARIVVLRKQGDSDPSKTIREEQESGGEDVQPPPLNPWLGPRPPIELASVRTC